MTRRRSSSPRLYLPAPLALGTRPLAPEREHYLRNVLRLKDGASVAVFDGDGRRGNAIAQREGRKLTLNIVELAELSPPSGPRMHLAFALLKGKANEQVLRRATELGATDLWPLYTDHTDVPRKLLATANGEHQLGIVISACEQCGQDQLPTLHPGQTLDALLEQQPSALRLLADMDAPDFPGTLSTADSMVIVGPEGGWSDRERALTAQHEVQSVNLGNLVLRAETAPIVALSMLTMAWRAGLRR